MKKTWTEKFQTRREPEVKRTEKPFADIPENAMMLIATPQIVEDYIRQIPSGRTTDLKTMRQDLALAHHAEYTCPVTSGIFLRIVAEANHERYQNGTPLDQIAPFWRIIDEKSPAAKKLSFGTAFLKERRNAEQ